MKTQMKSSAYEKRKEELLSIDIPGAKPEDKRFLLPVKKPSPLDIPLLHEFFEEIGMKCLITQTQVGYSIKVISK